MSTSPSDEDNVIIAAPPGLITKDSDHPLAMVLLGEVVGALWLDVGIILFYKDKHKALIKIDEDGDLAIKDHEVPTC